MGKLSKKKDKGAATAAPDKSQKKITGFFQTPKPFTSIQDLKQTQYPNSTDSENKNAPKGKSFVENLPKPGSSGLRPNHVQSMLNPSPASDVDFIENTPEKRKKTCKLRQTSSFAKRKLDEEPLNPTVKRIKEDVVVGDVNSDKENDDGKLDERRGAKVEALPAPVSKAEALPAPVSKAEALPAPVSEKKDLIMDKDETEDMFDDWDEDAFPEEANLLPLPAPPLAAKYNRHKILEIDDSVSRQLILVMEDSFYPEVKRKAIIKGTWLQTVVAEQDIVHIEGNFVQDVVTIDDKSGLLVVNPDLLVSGTAVVSALFCLRKAVLQEFFKGGGGGNKVMLVGTLVHELLQSVLHNQDYSRNRMSQLMDEILHSPKTVQELSYLGLTELEMRREIAPFLDHIQFFVKKYLHGQQVAAPEPSTPDRVKRGMERPQWKGRISNIVDIEENFWSPRLGVKGKIDISVGVKGDSRVLPLEIKTGKPSFSAEHSGQVMLYSMMSRDRRPDPGSGLLLYLRSSNMVEIQCKRNEEIGLIQLRNQLVAYLSQKAAYEEESVSNLILPEPLDFERACVKCEYLSICATFQKSQDLVPTGAHPMSRLVPETLAHLEPAHIAWFNHWTDMLRLEGGDSRSSLANLWCSSPLVREGEGSCIQDLVLASVAESTKHRFTRSNAGSSLPEPFSVGELVILSSTTELALSQGPVVEVGLNQITVQLDRDIREMPGWREKRFNLDRYVYQGGMSSNFVGVGKLLADSPSASTLRAIVIDKQPAKFLPGLVREVAITARGIIRNLNKVQQKAIFRCMMTENYSLLRGMPGSGKSTTIVGLVRLLAKLGQSVLLVAYTNSAVDTVLSKLKEFETKFLRLGRRSRVRQELQEYTVEVVSKNVSSCDEMTKLYNSYNIIATTCLATDHAAIVNRKFDWCIIDEASQALLPSVIHPILHAAKFILVGDPAQLPPVVQNHHARKLGLAESLFDRLDCPTATLDLNLQYRMNQTIADLANHLTYKGKLECATPEVAERRLNLNLDNHTRRWVQSALSSSAALSVVFLHTRCEAREVSTNNGVYNPAEARLVIALIKQAVKSGLAEAEIAVIAPYSAQVKHVKGVVEGAGLTRVEVGTVDQFQGRDSELVVYSCTRSFLPAGSENSGPRAGHILTDERRLNVALTRARSKVILVGDLDTLTREYKPFRTMKPFLEAGRIVNISADDIRQL